MRLKKGFTLIELLVVISIIAMLLAILMPALGAVKERARSVVCRANLHQWGLCYQLYASDWDGKLPTFITNVVAQTTYMESLREYYDDTDKMRTCPSATKIAPLDWTAWRPAGNIAGQANKAWYIDTANSTWMANDDWGVGSYGENSWIRETMGKSETWGSLTRMTRPSEVPLILDARWNNAWVTNARLVEVTSESQLYNIDNWSSMSCFAMRRHADGVNAAMADMSAIPVDAEELWTLKWHKEFKKVKDIDMPWLDW